MLANLRMLIPRQVYVLGLVGIGIATVIGTFSPAMAMGLLLRLCLIVMLLPFLSPLIKTLPDWAVGLLCLYLVMSLIRVFFGKRVQENVVSMILFNLMAFPFKVIRRLIGIGRWLH